MNNKDSKFDFLKNKKMKVILYCSAFINALFATVFLWGAILDLRKANTNWPFVVVSTSLTACFALLTMSGVEKYLIKFITEKKIRRICVGILVLAGLLIIIFTPMAVQYHRNHL